MKVFVTVINFVILRANQSKPMNIFTLSLAATAALACTATTAAAPSRVQMTPARQVITGMVPKSVKTTTVSAPYAGPKWLNTKAEMFFYDEEEGWIPDQMITTEYTADGRISTEVTEDYVGWSKITYGYAEGFPLFVSRLNQTSTDGVNYDNSVKTERAYDSRITELPIQNLEYTWSNDQWNQNGNNYCRTITRDADGNITFVQIDVMLDGEFSPRENMVIEYTDGKATSITQNELYYDYETSEYAWQEATRYTNIEWDTTDGQIFDFSYLTSGANKIKSFNIFNGGEPVGRCEYTYLPDNGGYSGVISMGDEVLTTILVEVLDSYGSFIQTETVPYGDGIDYQVVQEETYDEYEQLLLQTYAEYYAGEEIYSEKVIGKTNYSDEGYPVDYEQMMVSDGYEENMLRIEYLEYVEAPTSKAILNNSDDENAPVEYYNLQGIRVNTPTDGGIYIRKQGSNASKVLVK